MVLAALRVYVQGQNFQTNPRTCKSGRDDIQELVYEILECAVLDVLDYLFAMASAQAEAEANVLSDLSEPKWLRILRSAVM